MLNYVMIMSSLLATNRGSYVVLCDDYVEFTGDKSWFICCKEYKMSIRFASCKKYQM